MNPIHDEIFNYDFHRFVTQEPNPGVPPPVEPTKKFELLPPKKSEKSKKDHQKKKNRE